MFEDAITYIKSLNFPLVPMYVVKEDFEGKFVGCGFPKGIQSTYPLPLRNDGPILTLAAL